ncbi:MAG TPA: WecB/TagA/CpsF family glycosyltransferase [Rhizobacter sp.]|nr:WecB/TagA/CpsF family glycosyltransferase [Rhizobacter sp.]
MPPDFGRDVHCVLGLPFDTLTESQAEEALRRAARQRRRCFLSTPNLDFAVHCLTDTAFRESVLQSDMSVADGWPIVMVARLLGVPLSGRVAGSTLFERLGGAEGQPMTVYFFGGPDGSAELACHRVNSSAGPMTCVGFDAPGFGSVEAMSDADRLQRINASRADFLVVALGAKKGQAWIQHNLARIDTPLVSHLGAVVNFAAGRLRRAPRWVQQLGLEWLWRIREEPALWRRYANDGRVLLQLLATRVLPLAWELRWHAPRKGAPARVSVERAGSASVLRLGGAWTAQNLAPLREQLRNVAEGAESVALDLSELVFVDSAVIGLLALLYGWQKQTSLGWKVVAASHAVRRVIHLACAGYLLQEITASDGQKRSPSGA